MKGFAELLAERLELGGFTTEDTLASILPLMRQVIEAHQAGLVAPLDGIEALRVERSAIWFEESRRLRPTSNRSRVRALDHEARGVEIVSEQRRSFEVGGGGVEVEDLSLGEPGEQIVRPVYLEGYRSWEHTIGHHDPLTDVFSLGLILGSLTCGCDLGDPNDLRRFVAHRKNLFELKPDLHPVLAKAVVNMTELSRHRRPQDLRALMRSLEGYRDQEISFDFDLASIKGFGERDLEGKQAIILGRLQERLFEISRRNRLLHFRDSAGTVCLSEASVPLSFDVENVRPDQILTWGGRFRSELSAGKRVSLNRYMSFREALYLAPSLDRIRAQALRDQAELGFQQLRLVLCFLRWADVKATPPELYDSPLVLMGVKLVKKKGVRDTYHLEPHGTEAEINPVLRHMLKQLYDIDLPETIDLAVADLDELLDALKQMVESSDASITVSKIDRPRIDLIHEKARRRLAAYRRRVRVSGRGLRRFMDLDYSYHPANFHPLGLRIFNAWIRPAETHLRTMLQEAPGPRHLFAATPDAPESVRERKLFSLRDHHEGSPYAWELDLCRVTIGNFRYRKMTLVRDYAELLEQPRSSPAFEATFSLSPRPVELDEVSAPRLEQRYDIVACDPTQAAAIGLARAGASHIIQGPPGTGKSQTITNLIADFISRGKRVLFVCEKRAALDVVYSRLEHRGLQELCCLIHDSRADKRELVMDLKHTYESFVKAASEGLHRSSRQRQALDRLIQEEAEPLSEYAKAVTSQPEEAGISVQSLLERGIELEIDPPALSPLDCEKVPLYHDWISGRRAAQAFTVKLSAVQEDLVLARHPLRMLRASLHEVDRPIELVIEALDEVEPLLLRLIRTLSGLDLPFDCVSSVAGVARAVGFAVEARWLADRGLLPVLEPGSGPARRFAAGHWKLEKARAGLDKALASSGSWRDKLPRSELAAAMAEATRLEGRLLSVLSPAWWRLRRVLSSRYDLSAHAVRPTWLQVLKALENEYEAQSTVEAVSEELAESLGVDGDIDEALAEIEALRQRAEEPESRLLVTSLLRLRDPDRAVRSLAGSEPDLLTVQELLDDVVESVDDLALERLLELLQETRAALDELPGLLGCLSDLAAMPESLAAAFRRLPLTPRQLEAASIRRTLDIVLRKHHSIQSLSSEQRGLHASRLYTAHRRWLELNTHLLRENVRSGFVEHLRLASLPAAQLNDEQIALKKRYNKGRRELEHEFGKSMRYKAIRDLVAGDSGMVVDDLKPIWLMSPLSISDTLPLDNGRFDVVIFDEASQITLEEAVPALFRADQAIVVGDEMQLPPTNFFSAKLDDDASSLWLEEDGELIEYDLSVNSFLAHAAKNLPSRMLGWHYRSRSESLISFSNWAFYQGRLLTVPEEDLCAERRPEIVIVDPAKADDACAELLARAVSFHRLDGAVYQHRRNRAEADYIAHLVRALLDDGESPSIGIVAFSEAQQGEIQDALDRLGAEDPAFRDQLEAELTREHDGQHVGLLVKNLENIQGDERDVIILSVCYGPGPDGRTHMRFGPINQIGGEKRLNVAFSRAKHHMAVVSSMQHHDITNDYNDGARCLRRYLHYAAASSIGDNETCARILREMCLWRDPDEPYGSQMTSRVTQQIADSISGHGYLVEQAVGMSDFRCDLAVRREGESTYRLGILVDAASYYDDGDLLEREVFKPHLLTVFGWRVARVLCKDWYEDRRAVLSRLLGILDGRSDPETITLDDSFAQLLESRLSEAGTPPAAPPAESAEVAPAQVADSAVSSISGILDIRESTPRYFELVAGGSRKFWEITVSRDRYSVRFGRIGTAGQERVKSFASSDAALRAARRLISEKLGKGYEEKRDPDEGPE